MDFQEFWRKFKSGAKVFWQKFRSGTKTFWQWIKPYLIRFHHWRKRIWKKYHINKILLLLALVGVLVMSFYLFLLAKSVNVETLQSSLKQS
ncbi:MAG: penicillin-binding protein, partial [Enterococcus sp.]|nr:penicillin-binding protein [Enterococcus sp.]